MSKLVVSEQTAAWYAVYTKPRWEKKVAEGLKEKSIEYYCPLNRVVRQWSDRKKTIMEPLFSSYVFVHVAEDRKWQVKEVEGVLNYVYWLGKPALIPNEDIERIKRFLNEHEQVQVTSGILKINDKVRIISGPFMDKIASVISQKRNVVKLQIPALQIELSASTLTTDLETIH